MRTDGVLLPVAVADLRAAFDRVDDSAHAHLQTVFDGTAVWPGRFKTRDLPQSRTLSAANLTILMQKNRSVHREDFHHVAHGEVQSEHLGVALAACELERKSRLE